MLLLASLSLSLEPLPISADVVSSRHSLRIPYPCSLFMCLLMYLGALKVFLHPFQWHSTLSRRSGFFLQTSWCSWASEYAANCFLQKEHLYLVPECFLLVWATLACFVVNLVPQPSSSHVNSAAFFLSASESSLEKHPLLCIHSPQWFLKIFLHRTHLEVDNHDVVQLQSWSSDMTIVIMHPAIVTLTRTLFYQGGSIGSAAWVGSMYHIPQSRQGMSSRPSQCLGLRASSAITIVIRIVTIVMYIKHNHDQFAQSWFLPCPSRRIFPGSAPVAEAGTSFFHTLLSAAGHCLCLVWLLFSLGTSPAKVNHLSVIMNQHTKP